MNLNIKSDDIKLLVVKVGTTLVSSPGKFLDPEKMSHIVEDIATLIKGGTRIALVSSGAVGAGMGVLNVDVRPKFLPEKQAAAAIGQSELMHFYKELFNEHGIRVAQILLTKDDLDDRDKYLNARNTLGTLLDYENTVPIINENDTIAVDEINFGDNDTLSAVVAAKMQADLLVILSNVDGLYDCDPRKSDTQTLIEEVTDITDDLKAMCGSSCSETSVGGMVSKLEAARIATLSGIPMVLANGEREHVLSGLFKGDHEFTYFHPRKEAIAVRKRWIAFGSVPRGSVTVDEGAKRALLKMGRSLLPSGIQRVTGSFGRDDIISILDEDGGEIARGCANYSAEEVRIIMGKHSSKIAGLLENPGYEEVIHRDNMATL
jgi:glutamate 5-kinase